MSSDCAYTNLRQFRYDVVENSVNAFAPVMRAPIGLDYTIDPNEAVAPTKPSSVNGQLLSHVNHDSQEGDA
jgi:hypothetical protein